MELTNRQKEVLSTIQELTLKMGFSPTLKEIRDYLGYKNITSVQRHTEALKRKGYLVSDKHKPRSLVVKKDLKHKYNIPLVGVVTCGQPILAQENIEAYIPLEVKGDPKDFFILRVIGDSMNKADINNGDLVLIKKQVDAEPGDKVVALVGDEATIKIFKQEKDRVILEPRSTNPIHKPLYIFDNLEIQGKVVDVINN
jgi:repressor LexA